jgi:hypothetical protein
MEGGTMNEEEKRTPRRPIYGRCRHCGAVEVQVYEGILRTSEGFSGAFCEVCS